MEISNYIHKRIQLSIYCAKIALWRHIYKLIDSELGTLSGPFRRFPPRPRERWTEGRVLPLWSTPGPSARISGIRLAGGRGEHPRFLPMLSGRLLIFK